MRIVLPVILLCLVVGAKEAPREASSQSQGRPNILLVLTDDQDAGSISAMPNVQSLLVDRGTTYDRAFVTTPLCCPSRTSILRGQYAHNHGVWDPGQRSLPAPRAGRNAAAATRRAAQGSHALLRRELPRGGRQRLPLML